jgi:hypothetical protein
MIWRPCNKGGNEELKKDYLSPEFELKRFNFEKMLSDEYDHIQHSIPEDIGEQSGEGDF